MSKSPGPPQKNDKKRIYSTSSYDPIRPLLASDWMKVLSTGSGPFHQLADQFSTEGLEDTSSQRPSGFLPAVLGSKKPLWSYLLKKTKKPNN